MKVPDLPRRRPFRLLLATLLSVLCLTSAGCGTTHGGKSSAAQRQADACTQLYSGFIPQTNVSPPPVDLARPPVGYNPYNHASTHATQEDILAATAAMAGNGMQQSGYGYIDLDDGWQGPRDTAGNLTADPSGFGCGIGRLASTIHDYGFHFGIYTAASGTACGGGSGSAGHVDQDVAQFAKWGVDLIKLDWCNASYDASDVANILTAWQDAIRLSGRPMYLMVNAGGAPIVLKRAAPLASSFRVEGDICAAWTYSPDAPGCHNPQYNLGIKQYLLLGWNSLATLGKPSHHPDADMLEVGVGNLTLDEAQTHFTMWAMWSAPLLAGNDVTRMDGHDLASQVLLNRRIIAVDQDSLGQTAQLLRTTAGVQYWRKPLAGGVAIAAVNLGEHPADIKLTLADAGLSNPTSVQDLWSGDRFSPTTYYGSTLRPHAVRIMKIYAR